MLPRGKQCAKSCKRSAAEELQAQEGGRWHPAAATEPGEEMTGVTV